MVSVLAVVNLGTDGRRTVYQNAKPDAEERRNEIFIPEFARRGHLSGISLGKDILRKRKTSVGSSLARAVAQRTACTSHVQFHSQCSSVSPPPCYYH